MMKTAELTGAQLDYWVAKALDTGARAYGWTLLIAADGSVMLLPDRMTAQHFQPSTRWDHGGPIIERERIALEGRFRNGLPAGEWTARIVGPRLHFGPTPLVAAMRAYVASKFGDEVPE